jgi:hypothetical protein
MRSKWITHRGKRILYSDYTQYSIDDFSALKAELASVEAEICTQPEGSVLLITDVTGITRLKKILFDAVVKFSGQNAKAFDDLDKGKDWLAGQD